jgi:hypothetical protein
MVTATRYLTRIEKVVASPLISVTFTKTLDRVPKKKQLLPLLRYPPMDNVLIMRFEPLCLMPCHYIKLNPCPPQTPRDRTGDNQVLFALDDEERR